MLARSEARLKSLFEHMPDFVIVVDREGTIQFANHAVTGATVEELTGHSGPGFLVPESEAVARQALAAALQTQEVQNIEILDMFGAWFSSRVVPIVEEGEARTAMVISTDVTRRKKIEADLLREQELIRHLLELAEREREVVAFEIHDGFAQQLAGAKMQFEAAIRVHDSNPDQAKAAFDRGLQLLREGIQESRRLVSGLRPPVLDAFGVVAAIEHLVLQARGPEGPEIELDVELREMAPDGRFQRLAQPLENALFRIVQESLNNALKHSRSPKIRVHLADDGELAFPSPSATGAWASIPTARRMGTSGCGASASGRGCWAATHKSKARPAAGRPSASNCRWPRQGQSCREA